MQENLTPEADAELAPPEASAEATTEQPVEQQEIPQSDEVEAQEEEVEPKESAAHSWSSLIPDNRQLLRLAPLPADRETGLRPLLFGSFGQVEKHSASQSMLKLSLNFPGHSAAKGVNTLEVWADHATKKIYVYPENGLRVEPANRGLGRFMLAMAARWARKKCSGYQVRNVSLLVKHVANDGARFRRDHALQAQGFTVNYEDGVKMRANCSVSKASEINTEWNNDKVRLIETLEVADILQKADKSLKEQESEIKKLSDQLTYLKKDDGTLRFTITMLVVFAIFQAGLLIWMATQ